MPCMSNNLRRTLTDKTRDDLHVIAKRLKIKGYRRLNREDLTDALLKTRDKDQLAKSLSVTWWDRNHNHVYGVAGVIGVILTIAFYL
jgi:hypothetical protein